MKKFIHSHKLLAAVLAVMLLCGALVVGVLASDVQVPYDITSGSILEQLPLYTYGGTYVQTYSMGASGKYYEKDGVTQFGEDVTDDLGGGEMLVFKNVTSDSSYNSYRKDLEDYGFLFYNDNDLDGNLHATYVTEETVVTLSYLKNLKQLNILAEPMRTLPGLEEENVYQNLKVENKAIVMTCGYIGNENGMCIAYQLCDGSFMIYDSGYGFGYHPGGTKGDGYKNYWQNQAKEIYATLDKMAKESGVNEIVIAAWFFSHPHWDHIGGFIPFATLYGDQVTLEKVVFNWPNQETLQEMIHPKGQKMSHYVEEVQNAVAKFEGAQMVEAHAGQTFYIRDAEIDVLMTWELQTEWSNSWISINEGNSGTVFSIKLGGERIIMLGDCGKSATDTMLDLYSAEFLKSDFLQVAHHGYNAFTKPLNNRVNPDVVLWTNDNLSSSSLANNFTDIPETVYNHDERITLINLPYTGEVEYWDCQFPLR